MADDQSTPDRDPRDIDIDTSVSHVARIWNYWLGGKDNYVVDREVGDQILEILPDVARLARASRVFLSRAVRYLAGEAGVRQFLDVGTGLPTVDNTHEVAQRVARDARIVYVDNDPLVLTHARALLTSTPEGATHYIDTNLHDPDTVVREASKLLDFTQPIGLMLLNILGHVVDYDEARSIARHLIDALPPGSHMALVDGTNIVTQASDAAQDEYNESGAIPYVLRSPEQIAAFFDGLELIEPGVVSTPRWRPEALPFGEPDAVDAVGGVGRKP